MEGYWDRVVYVCAMPRRDLVERVNAALAAVRAG